VGCLNGKIRVDRIGTAESAPRGLTYARTAAHGPNASLREHGAFGELNRLNASIKLTRAL